MAFDLCTLRFVPHVDQNHPSPFVVVLYMAPRAAAMEDKREKEKPTSLASPACLACPACPDVPSVPGVPGVPGVLSISWVRKFGQYTHRCIAAHIQCCMPCFKDGMARRHDMICNMLRLCTLELV